MSAFEFSLQDIKSLIDSAVGALRDDLKDNIKDLKNNVDTLFTDITTIKDAVNPRMERYGRDLKHLKESIEEHEDEHKDLKQSLKENNRDSVTKKSFKWQKIFIICLIAFNFLSISLTVYITLIK